MPNMMDPVALRMAAAEHVLHGRAALAHVRKVRTYDGRVFPENHGAWRAAIHAGLARAAGHRRYAAISLGMARAFSGRDKPAPTVEATAAGAQYVIPGAEKRQARGAAQLSLLL